MEKLTVLLIEDEPLAMAQLERLILKDERFSIVGKLDSVSDLKDWFDAHSEPHLILSDIQLSDGNSIQWFAEMGKDLPVVFITAYDQYAIDAFKLQAIDYLLKPIDDDKLTVILDKLYQEKSGPQNIDYEKLAEMVFQKMHPRQKHFLIKFAGQLINLKAKEIAYFFIDEKLTMCMTFKGKKYPIDEPLDQLDKALSSTAFFRINRAMIVNEKSIEKMIAYSRSRIKLKLNPEFFEDVIVSRDKTPIFKEWLISRDQLS